MVRKMWRVICYGLGDTRTFSWCWEEGRVRLCHHFVGCDVVENVCGLFGIDE